VRRTLLVDLFDGTVEVMKIINVPAGHDVNVRLQLSSNAETATMRVIFEGGQSLDPRDPTHLALLPVADNIEIDLSAAQALRAGLDEFITLLAENADDANADRPPLGMWTRRTTSSGTFDRIRAGKDLARGRVPRWCRRGRTS